MKKLLLLLLFLISNIIFASIGTSQEMYNKMKISNKPVLIKGYKEAKKNIQTIFNYNQNYTYTIYCRINFLSSIILSPDEKITFVGGGDTARWLISNAETGSIQGTRDVIYIKPIETSLKTNLIINTNKRSYNINLISSKTLLNPVVKWNYPHINIIKRKLENKKAKEEKMMSLTNTQNLNYKYTVSTKRYSFCPSVIFDDGNKTIFVMKDKLQELPVFYIREDRKLILANYRVKGNYFIIDRLFKEGILRIGKKQIIIKNRS